MLPPSYNTYNKLRINISIDTILMKLYDELIESYFRNISRMKDIQLLYEYINDNINYLYSWY